MLEPKDAAERLGGLLPRRTREDLFTPALHDLRIEARSPAGQHFSARFRFGVRVALLFLDCVRVSLTPEWPSGRPRRSRSTPLPPEPTAMIVVSVRQAFGRLFREPGFTAAAVLTLALGVGLNVAVFAVFEAVVLRPLPYPDGDQIVIVNHRDRVTGVTKPFIAAGDYVDIAGRRQSLDELATYGNLSVTVFGEGDPFRVPALQVGPGMLDLLRYRGALGRSLRPEDHLVGSPDVAVLGHRLWAERFGSDPAVVGRSVSIGGRAHEIVGVAPEGFAFPPGASVDLVLPAAVHAEAPAQRKAGWYFAAGRLAPGQTAQTASDDLARVAAWMEAEYPDQNAGSEYYATPLRDHMVGNTKRALQLMLVAVGFVMLIACANVANLQLARSLARRKDIAVRLALGSGWGRIAGQFLAESLALALMAGASGATLAAWGSRLLVALVPSSVGAPGLLDVRLNSTVLGFALLLTFLTAVTFGLLAAATVRADQAGGALVAAGRASRGPLARRMTSALVVAEVALALVLVIGAGLVMRTFDATLAVDPGFEPDGVLVAQVSIPQDRYADAPARAAFHRALADALLAVPGVGAVGTAVVTPLTGNNWTTPFERADQRVAPGERPPDVGWQAASGDWFRTMGIPLRSGRLFDARDEAPGPLPVIVSRSLEERFFPGGSAIGQQVFIGGTEAEIVGVVGDIHRADLTVPPREDLYLPMERDPSGQAGWFVRADGRDPSSFGPALRAVLREVEPDALLGEVRSMSDVAARSAAVANLLRWLFGVFSVSALVLAAVGIYGVMSYAVRQRTREIGTRMAVGATEGDILRLVLRDGAVVGVAGVGLGLGAGLLAARALRSVLFGVSSADPVTLLTAAALLLVTALAASWLPASRASSVDAARTLAQP